MSYLSLTDLFNFYILILWLLLVFIVNDLYFVLRFICFWLYILLLNFDFWSGFQYWFIIKTCKSIYHLLGIIFKIIQFEDFNICKTKHFHWCNIKDIPTIYELFCQSPSLINFSKLSLMRILINFQYLSENKNFA